MTGKRLNIVTSNNVYMKEKLKLALPHLYVTSSSNYDDIKVANNFLISTLRHVLLECSQYRSR